MQRLYRSQVIRFIAVGCGAAVTHWAVAMLCVVQLALAPLLANVAGWVVAFGVSFGGHYHLTFRDHNQPFWLAARRFFLVSLAGFLVNESAYAVALKHLNLRYDILLAIILAAMAVITFIVSRYWAFRRTAASNANIVHEFDGS